MRSIALLIFLILIQTALGQNVTEKPDSSTFIFHSDILNEDRKCLIQFPETYHDTASSERNYPIILLLDGATFFKTTSSIVHFMTSDRNRNYMMPETIIIAIENVDRRRDFTVTRIETKRPNTSGGGTQFLDFIEKELIPYLDKNYRTAPHRTLVGHSLGGLLTLNAYRNKDRILNAYLAIDPSIWWDEETMKTKVEEVDSICFRKKLYIATANQGESNYERNKKRHDTFYALMKKRAGDKLNIRLDFFEHESHRSVPLKAIYEGLKYLNQ